MPDHFLKTTRTVTSHLLVRIVLVQWFSALCVVAQPLSEGWWLQNSAEDVLTQAQTRSKDLTFFKGRKEKLLNDPETSIDFFQRKTPGGFVETKLVSRYPKNTIVEFRNERGTFIFASNRLVKPEFEDDQQQEASLASETVRPYSYKILETPPVGTNACFIVARIATPEFLRKLREVLYPGFEREKNTANDPIQYIRSEVHTYIRKVDGVVVGQLKRNHRGELLDDFLYNVVEVNVPISDSEFILPSISINAATNMAQLYKTIREGRLGGMSAKSPDRTLTRYGVIGFAIISLGVSAYFLKRFRRE